MARPMTDKPNPDAFKDLTQNTHVGDLLEITIDDRPRTFVVEDTLEDGFFGDELRLTSNGRDNAKVVVRRGEIQYGPGIWIPVEALSVLNPSEVDDEDVLALRESILANADLDEEADKFSVRVSKEWTKAGTEGGRDDHATLQVTGPGLDEPVTVHVRSAFDIGFSVDVRADLDDHTTRVLERVARANSPVSTGPR